MRLTEVCGNSSVELAGIPVPDVGRSIIDGLDTLASNVEWIFADATCKRVLTINIARAGLLHARRALSFSPRSR